MSQIDYVIRVLDAPAQIAAEPWNALLAQQSHATPFMRHEYLDALHRSGSACPTTGWHPRFITLWQDKTLVAACPLYLKDHSYGEYVFDWAWANAYAEHGLAYYPKALIAVPYTPVPGTRLLARDAAARAALLRAVLAWCAQEQLSSWHLLFGSEEDLAACAEERLMLRHTVQFHWTNVARTVSTDRPSPLPGFDDFLATLSQDKRKKIKQERRKVAHAGVTFHPLRGRDITAQDWDFFYRCYERTYLEHGNAPYLSRDFFARMALVMPENWLLFVAQREGRAIASSLIALNDQKDDDPDCKHRERVAYGRYWGALERVDCLHFEACYYQPLAWCIAHGYSRFEGGAQGEHKMARALMPVKSSSAHGLAHPAFASAVEKFLAREGRGVEHYLDDLAQRSPLKQVRGDAGSTSTSAPL